jgi:hypothetical protein
VVQTIPSGGLDILLRSQGGVLRQGRGSFEIEFRSRDGGTLVDVGTVRATANMSMPGMAMSGGLQVMRGDVAGRYVVTNDFGMAGTWQMAIEWSGPVGQGMVNFQGNVR